MTEDDFLDRLALEEGTSYAEPPAIDQPTGPYGITRATLEQDCGRKCFTSDLKLLTPADAREVARRKVRRDLAALGLMQIAFEPLRYQLLDFDYQSGGARAIRWLQRTVGVPEAMVTGEIDTRTLVALARHPATLVNNALAAERGRAAYHGGTDPKFAAGVARRALEFVIPLDEQPMTT